MCGCPPRAVGICRFRVADQSNVKRTTEQSSSNIPLAVTARNRLIRVSSDQSGSAASPVHRSMKSLSDQYLPEASGS